MMKVFICSLLIAFLVGTSSSLADFVDLSLVQNSCSAVDSEVRVDIVATADGRLPQLAVAFDVILSWNPEQLTFLRIETDDAGSDWLVADFLNDPDGINDDIDDGEALLTMLAMPGETTIVQTNCGTVLATLVFKLETRSAVIEIIESVGVFGSTAIYPPVPGAPSLLGDFEGTMLACRKNSIQRTIRQLGNKK